MVETIGQSTSQFDLSRSTHHGGTDAITASSNGVHSMSGVDLNGSYSIPVGYFDHRFDTGHASSSTPATYMLTTQLGAGTFNGMGSYTSPQEPANGLPEPSPVIRDGLARDSGAGQVRQKRAYGKSCAACKRRKRKCPVRRRPLLGLTCVELTLLGSGARCKWGFAVHLLYRSWHSMRVRRVERCASHSPLTDDC